MLILKTLSRLGPASIVPEIRQAAQREAPGAPLYDLRTIEEQVSSRLQVERMIATLAAYFGGLAMALAVVGL
jgi:hypothetical protein